MIGRAFPFNHNGANMLDELKFVMGAVGKTDMVSAMTHFCIEAGQVRATNGRIAIGSPIACDLDIRPKADQMVAAIAHCEDTITLNMTAAGFLRVKSGRFAVSVPCSPDPHHYPRPEGLASPLDGVKLREALAVLKPFMADRRAPQDYAKGVGLRGKSAFATNGHAVGEYWIGSAFPRDVIIPYDTVIELLRVKDAPKYMQIDDRSITFHYERGRWIRTALIAAKFPDVSALFEKVEGNWKPMGEEVFTVAKKLKKFVGEDGSMYMDRGNFRTQLDTNEGAKIDFDFADDIYRLKLNDLLDLDGLVNEIEFHDYKSNKPLFFRGGMFRAAVQVADPRF